MEGKVSVGSQARTAAAAAAGTDAARSHGAPQKITQTSPATKGNFPWGPNMSGNTKHGMKIGVFFF